MNTAINSDLTEINNLSINQDVKLKKLISSGDFQDITDYYIKLEELKYKTLSGSFKVVNEEYDFIFLVFKNSRNPDILSYFINEYDDKLSKKKKFNFGALIIKFSKNIKDYKALFTIIDCKFVSRKDIDAVFYSAIFEAIKNNNTKALNLLKFKASAKLTFYSNNKIEEFKKYMDITDEIDVNSNFYDITKLLKDDITIKLDETESDIELDFDYIDKSEC